MTISRVFLDASALFAAAYSSAGYARDLVLLAVRGRVRVVVSQDVLAEVERNMRRKAPERVENYHRLLALFDLEIVADPSSEDVKKRNSMWFRKMRPLWPQRLTLNPHTW